MKYGIRETHGTMTSMIMELQHDCRGWHRVTKKFNTERAAKNWIRRRMNQLAEAGQEDEWQYEVVEVHY